ncbi:MAG TPA: trypsin-like peptidase domain-containing protein [Candidatus Acidoferrum sp.]|nr:trypsin-like peptidase domain-containing protein [Candidatus Acidoferrum sp.]
MSAEWVALSNALAEATEKAAAYTVAVHSEPRGSASGVIWRSGLIVTAEHALRRDEEIQVTLPDGKVASAKLLGRDPSTDIALLKCEAATAAPVSFGESTAFKPGQLALIVGRTRVSGPVAALGCVSLVTSERRIWGGAAISPYVRLDAALQRTAVGSAVVDANGQIAGIATPKFAPGGALALPVATVNRVVDALASKGHIPRGYLGVGLQPIRLPEYLRETLQRREKTAVIVLEVEPEGPAQKAGVVIGDILIALGGKPVMRLEDVYAHLHGEQIGKPVSAEFLRGGERREVSIAVGERQGGGN